MAEIEPSIEKARDIVEEVEPIFHKAVQRVYYSSRKLPDWIIANAGYGMGATVGLCLAFKVMSGEAKLEEVGKLLTEAAEHIYGSQGITPEYEEVLNRLSVFMSEVAGDGNRGRTVSPSSNLDEIAGEIGVR